MSMEVIMVALVIIFGTLMVMNAVYDRVVFWGWGMYNRWKYPLVLTLADYVNLQDDDV